MRHIKKAIILSTCLLTTSLYAAGGDGEYRELSKEQAIDLIMQDTSGLTQSEKVDIAKRSVQQQLEDEQLDSLINDQVVPIREPIFISSNPSAKASNIFVARSRPTTITFFKQGGVPLRVIDFKIQEPEGNPRFKVQPIKTIENAYNFSTTRLDGSTMVDFFFEDVPYSIPIRLIAGFKYHSSSQAVLIDDTAPSQKVTDENQELIAAGGEPELTLKKIMYIFANYGEAPKGSSTVQAKFYSSSQIAQPSINVVKTKIGDQMMYLIRTTGLIRHPDYIASEPAAIVSDPIWVYAIPSSKTFNMLTLSYKGGNHLVTLEEDGYGLHSAHATTFIQQ